MVVDKKQTKIGQAFKLSIIFLSISLVAVIGFGFRAVQTNTEVKELKSFLANASNVQPNFEKSLAIYTEQTKDAINYLLELRPENESDYVEFISAVENLSSELNLDVELKALEGLLGDKAGNNKEYIMYEISFLGGLTQLESFLSGLAGLNYYVGIQSLDYRDLRLVAAQDAEEAKNIKLAVKLFIK